MIEIPEAQVWAAQLGRCIGGKRIVRAEAAHSSHKFAWYNGDPGTYPELLEGKTVDRIQGFGGMVEIAVQDACLLFCDGAALRWHEPGAKQPEKHQFIAEFEDGSAFTVSIQMYGAVWAFREGSFENGYYLGAKNKVSPLGESFTKEYFKELIRNDPEYGKLSAKAALATGQRIPGLGNGVLQDMLFHARIHPKRKVSTLDEQELEGLYHSIKSTLGTMIAQGGRDTEKDVYGNPGGYRSILSKNTLHTPCPVCGTSIEKVAYLGGAVYWCSSCQK